MQRPRVGVNEIAFGGFARSTWAYAGQARIDGVKEKFGDSVRLDYRFCSVFDDTADKITSTWRDKGEYAGFNSHLRKVALQFPHIEVHPEIWLKTRPPTSASPHLILTAVRHWNKSKAATAKEDQRHQDAEFTHGRLILDDKHDLL